MEEKKVIIAISMEAKKSLDGLQERINQDHLGGRVKKCDVASWLISQSETLVSEVMISDIRKAHRNAVHVAQNIHRKIKQAEKDGMGEVELRCKLRDLLTENGFERFAKDIPGDGSHTA